MTRRRRGKREKGRNSRCDDKEEKAEQTEAQIICRRIWNGEKEIVG